MSLIKLILLTSFALSTSCNAGEIMNVEGQLIYTNGGRTINAINLDSSESKISSFYENKEIVHIEHLTMLNNNSILFSECTVTGDCIIKQYTVNTKQAKFFHSGRLPSYISNHDKLFFYDKFSDGNNWLFATSVKNINAMTKVAREPKWNTLPNGVSQPITIAVIQISNDEIIFVGEDKKLWKYNIANKELTSMNIGNCRPILWRERHNQLLCSDWDTWMPFLLDMNTKIKKEMPELKGAYGFVYIPSSDSIIYGRMRSSFIIGEAHDIFLYSFSDKKEKRIKKNSHVADGIWIER